MNKESKVNSHSVIRPINFRQYQVKVQIYFNKTHLVVLFFLLDRGRGVGGERDMKKSAIDLKLVALSG